MPKKSLLSGRPRIFLDNERIEKLEADLLELEIVQALNASARCTCRFLNWTQRRGRRSSYAWFDDEALDHGVELRVEINYRDTDLVLFEGPIRGLEGDYPADRAPEIIVLAEDALARLRRVERSRVFEQVSDQEIVEFLAQEHGLEADASLDGPTRDTVVQLQETDLAFAVERARGVGAEIWLREGVVMARRRGDDGWPVIGLSRADDIDSIRVGTDLVDQVTAQGVRGWSFQEKALVADSESQPAGIDDGQLSGGAVHESALGARKVQVAPAPVADNEEAQVLAGAYLGESGRGFVSGRGTGSELPHLSVGRQASIEGLGSIFDGQYTVVEVVHRFDSEYGFATEFAIESPGIPARTRSSKKPKRPKRPKKPRRPRKSRQRARRSRKED